MYPISTVKYMSLRKTCNSHFFICIGFENQIQSNQEDKKYPS